MSQASAFDLREFPVHLGLGARVRVQERFDGDMRWYERYGERTESDGVEGRLVSLHRFGASWDSWEMHPKGEELVVCVEGEITLVQEIDGQPVRVTLSPGMAAVNPAGVWHTADVDATATALFITAGVGTEVRPRDDTT